MIYRQSFLGVSLSRRANRRWIVVGWWLVVVATFGVGAFLLKDQPRWPHSVLSAYVCVFAFFAINSPGSFIWVRRPDPKKFSAGIRTLFDAAWRAELKKNPAADEREQRQWDKATGRAYEFLLLAFLLYLPLHYFGLMPHARVFRDLLVWFAFFVVVQLPNAIYLWTEPDMEEAQ